MSDGKCPSTEQWEQYVLDEAPQLALQTHLATCFRCQLLVHALREELAGEAEAWDQSAVIRLAATRPLHDLTTAAAEPLLAAQGQEKPEDTNVLVLSSPGQEMLLRALRDNRSGEVWLYLLADDPALVQNALVRPFGMPYEYVTDEQGRINLGSIDWPAGNKLEAEVRLPKATFQLRQLSESGTELTSPTGDRIRVMLSSSEAGRRLRIELIESPSIPGRGVIVAVRTKGTTKIWGPQRVAANQAEFGNIEAPDEVEIFFYHS